MATVAGSITKYSKLNAAAILQCDGSSQYTSVTTTPGTAQLMALSGTDSLQVLRIVPTDCDIWVKTGVAVTAAVGSGILVRDGMVEYFAINVGDSVSIFEAI